MILFESDSASAAFWFAAEEYIMRVLKPDETVLMMWSTDDTIMVGANQITEAECDPAYAIEAGIKIVRRSSGGGTIFTDRGTLQVTIILPFGPEDDNKTVIKERLAGPVIAALARCGINARLEGRNDLVIEGKKISGVAQYIKDGYICSHCSLLFRTDLDKLARSLTVDRTKYETKAIASVRSRVANISDFIAGQDLQIFLTALAETFGQGGDLHSRVFTEDELGDIENIMREKYRNPEWTFGHEPAFTFTNKKRFPGGQLEVYLDVKGGVIIGARIHGDFLSLLPVAELESILRGVPHRKDALAEALDGIDVAGYLGLIVTTELLEVLL